MKAFLRSFTHIKSASAAALNITIPQYLLMYFILSLLMVLMYGLMSSLNTEQATFSFIGLISGGLSTAFIFAAGVYLLNFILFVPAKILSEKGKRAKTGLSINNSYKIMSLAQLPLTLFLVFIPEVLSLIIKNNLWINLFCLAVGAGYSLAYYYQAIVLAYAATTKEAIKVMVVFLGTLMAGSYIGNSVI